MQVVKSHSNASHANADIAPAIDVPNHQEHNHTTERTCKPLHMPCWCVSDPHQNLPITPSGTYSQMAHHFAFESLDVLVLPRNTDTIHTCQRQHHCKYHRSRVCPPPQPTNTMVHFPMIVALISFLKYPVQSLETVLRSFHSSPPTQHRAWGHRGGHHSSC
jgi:hypothetical protein